MKITTAFLDLDRTLVTEDLLDIVCEIVGKRADSEALNDQFRSGARSGSETIVDRINLLKGVSVSAIEEKLGQRDYLRQGAQELVDYLRGKRVTTVIQSRNITPVLAFYQRVLGTRYILGTDAGVVDEVIQGVTEAGMMKSERGRLFLEQHGILPSEALAIGDSMGDRRTFELVGASIAINPTGGIERYATAVIYDDLNLAIPIIEEMLR